MTYAQFYNGLCPFKLGSPVEKEINILYNHNPPFTMYAPVGGIDFVIIELLAKRLGFIPKYIPYSDLQSNGSTKPEVSISSIKK